MRIDALRSVMEARTDAAPMRIAIVAPSPSPFLVGGAENLWWGMLAYLREETDPRRRPDQAAVKETTLADLVAGYEAFSRLDLSGFDAVISTKYPAWMVEHPNHTVYLQHRCRGFYDWYPEAELGGIAYRGHDPGILDLLEFVERPRGERAALPEFFQRFRELSTRRQRTGTSRGIPDPSGGRSSASSTASGLARTSIKR
jgi:hypothetical protein